MPPDHQAIARDERKTGHDPIPTAASLTPARATISHDVIQEFAFANILTSSRQDINDNHPGSDIAQTLAYDVLLTLFDPFSFPELLELSSVCRQWRAVVCAHPTYWRSVSLTKPADGAVDFFFARVSTSSTALIAITVRTRVLTNARLVRKVLDAICDNLGRIKSLDLDFDSFPTSSHHSVTRALSNPAPSLQHLALRSSSPTVVLPRRLFGCELPQLQKLTLVGFDSQTSYPLAFGGGTELAYAPATGTSLEAQRNFAQTLRWHRDLKTLTLLASPSYTFLCTALPSLATLSALHLHVVGHDLIKWLDTLQHLHTISVSRLSGCPVTDDAFFRHLKGDLSIAIPRSGWNNVARTVRIEVTETGPSKRSRCVTREPIGTLFDAPLRDNSVITKVTAATIPFGLLLPIGRWFDSNALSLRQMRVVIGNGVDEYSDAYEPVHAFLNCPKLEILEVISGSPSRTHLSQKDLYYLASKVLRAPFAALEIVLENVTIGGSDRYSDHSHSCQLWDSSECKCCDGDGCLCCKGVSLP